MPQGHSTGLETLWWRPFLAALLLTGDPEQAETAVLRSLRDLPAGSFDGTSFMLGSVAAAVQMQGSSREEPSYVPHALGRVLRIAPLPRWCFTLRILEGLPREMCASMLGIDADEVDEQAGIAARTLAELCGKDGAR